MEIKKQKNRKKKRRHVLLRPGDLSIPDVADVRYDIPLEQLYKEIEEAKARMVRMQEWLDAYFKFAEQMGNRTEEYVDMELGRQLFDMKEDDFLIFLDVQRKRRQNKK